MADDKSSGGWGSSFIVLAFAAVSALYVAHQKPPLVSTRPTDTEFQVNYLGGVRQDIEARLWQDPLAAIERDVDVRHGRDRLGTAGRHATLGFDHPGEPTLVLGVTLPWARYPEVAETRRRLRYAVLSALHVAGYRPTDEKHIGYWRPRDAALQPAAPQSQVAISNDWPPAIKAGERGKRFDAGPGPEFRPIADAAQKADNAAQSAATLPSLVPWEEFDREPDPDRHVLGHHVVVLWLDQDVLTAGRVPIRSLVDLRSRLGAFRESNFALLGPEDSTMLAAMLNEAGPAESDGHVSTGCRDKSGAPPNTGIWIYNFGATAEERRLPQHTGCGSIADWLRQAGITYYRTVNTDDELAKSLACELMRRDPNLDLTTDQCKRPTVEAGPGKRDHVVLISDWDTIYGDYLPKSVEEAFEVKEPRNGARPNSVTQVNYLRGLDGRLPDRKYPQPAQTSESGSGQKPADATEATSEPAAATPETASQFEGAEGQSQFDYLRRLANELQRRDAEFRRTDGGHIAAIGVLGSDVYDKLLILQALRPEFPEALFFTTDLDALLLPQNKTRYTRGLLVASSFGLQLNPKLQADLPPFRNTYQTSTFLATGLAIEKAFQDGASNPANPANEEIKKLIALPSWALPPVLFQIGRKAPMPLPSCLGTPPCAATGDGTPASGADDNVVTLLSAVQPPADKLFPELPEGAYVSASLACAVLLLGALFSFRASRHQLIPPPPDKPSAPAAKPPRYRLIMATSLIALGVSFGFWSAWRLLADWLTEYNNGEPMALFEGISLWPTILLRALGIGLTFWLICYARRSLQDNKIETDKELGLVESWPSLGQEWRRIRSDAKSYPTRTAQIKALLWFDRAPRGPGERPEFEFKRIVGGFAIGWPARCIRAGIGTVGMFALWIILVPIFGEPYVSARGPLVVAIYQKVTRIDVVLTLFLIFVVADAALFSRAFIKRLTAIKTVWPTKTVIRFTNRFKLLDADLADWIDMHFLATRTRCITRLIYLPFIALAVLVISRSQLFDNFTMPWTLVITQALSVAIIIGAFTSLRAAAERARTVAHDHLTAMIIAARANASSHDRASQLESLLAQIDGLNDGAFAPLSSQPLVKAGLLPLLTYGGTMLLHFYALPGT